MERSIKIILFIIIGIVVINFIATIVGNSGIKEIRQDLLKARRSADSALTELQYSKNRLDSIKSDLVIFRSYVGRTQKTVELADLEKRLAEERDQAKLAEIRQRIHELRAGLDTTQLPDIETVYKTDH